MAEYTPKQIVKELNRFIIGQNNAKKSVAIALRNRYRRTLLPEHLIEEVTPKNIIMSGPTGVGKTEIARRLSKLVKAPFVKVEATKFTEVGYVGRDVESMVRDLVEASILMSKKIMMEGVQEEAKAAAEERVLDALLPPRKRTKKPTMDNIFPHVDSDAGTELSTETDTATNTREKFRKRLREGKFDNSIVEIEITEQSSGAGMIPGMGNEDMIIQVQDMFGSIFPKKTKRKKTTVEEAFKLFQEEEAANLIDMDEVKREAIHNAEQKGIIFIDEIDKIAGNRGGHGPEVSREGVQRDILPIVEGTTVTTKHGQIKTDHILFIASGAFHVSKITDLIPELQGRFPIRVSLDALTEEDFAKILTQTDNALIKQEVAMMFAEGVKLMFTDDAITEIAKLAFIMNEEKENIGARRLHTIMEKLMEELSFCADELAGQDFTIDAEYVSNAFKDTISVTNLDKYIL